jgi:23S rRNA pseudouridine1911/1915/1917 synthase
MPTTPGLSGEAEAATMAVRVLFEDSQLLAVEKPTGLVTHPAYRHPNGTLCDLIFARQAARGEGRPWLLHRLDRETSGVLLFAKTEGARRALVRQFERHTIQKRYLALVAGELVPEEGLIEAPLRRDPADRRRTIVDPTGQASATRYRLLAHGGRASLVLAEPLTGRTHQIRAHFAWWGAPLLGDARYQPTDQPTGAEGGLAHPTFARTMLHAWRLDFRYPSSGEPRGICAPPPPDFRAALLQVGIDESVITTSFQEAPCN